MERLRFLTSGESHGPGLTGIIEGIPSGLALSAADIDPQLARRQMGYGRGGRMKIESDRARVTSGVRWGRTLGGPISLFIENRDWVNWRKGMSPDAEDRDAIEPVVRPRPGHADLVGALKYDHDDVRNVLERSSARETAMKVGLGAVAKRFLAEFGIAVLSYVREIGPVRADADLLAEGAADELFRKAEESEVRCPFEETSAEMMGAIDEAIAGGYSLGGIFDVITTGLPPGLGSFIQWDRRLNASLARALMGIQAIKGVEIGLGFDMARRPGSEVMDEIFHDSGGYYRKSNHSGGIEGGMSTGMPLVVRAAMKPIPTLRRPLRSVNIRTREPMEAAYERSDVCAVPAAAVVGEAMVALVLADEMLLKFGGDSMREILRNFEAHRAWLTGREGGAPGEGAG